MTPFAKQVLDLETIKISYFDFSEVYDFIQETALSISEENKRTNSQFYNHKGLLVTPSEYSWFEYLYKKDNEWFKYGAFLHHIEDQIALGLFCQSSTNDTIFTNGGYFLELQDNDIFIIRPDTNYPIDTVNQDIISFLICNTIAMLYILNSNGKRKLISEETYKVTI